MPVGAASPQAIATETDIKVPRIHALDALRGIFSVVIMMGHFFVTLPLALQYQYSWVMLATPLRMGFAFVASFFMLSGFVLALPYAGPRPPSYGLFLIKRMGRLYLPFAALMVLVWVMLIAAGVSRPDANAMSFHIENLAAPQNFTLVSLTRALLLTGLRADNLLDPAIWSLTHEFRISLFFPLLVLLCRRVDVGVTAMVVFYLATFVLKHAVGDYVIFPALMDDYGTSWITTLYLAPCFMFGIFLALHRERMARYLARRRPATRALLWALVAINFCFITDIDVRQPFTEFGSALLILLVLSSEGIARKAENRVLQWLGRISYSTYLVHIPILYVLREEWEGSANRILLFVVCIALTLPIATLTQRFIEVPSRRIAGKAAHLIFELIL